MLYTKILHPILSQENVRTKNLHRRMRKKARTGRMLTEAWLRHAESINQQFSTTLDNPIVIEIDSVPDDTGDDLPENKDEHLVNDKTEKQLFEHDPPSNSLMLKIDRTEESKDNKEEAAGSGVLCELFDKLTPPEAKNDSSSDRR